MVCFNEMEPIQLIAHHGSGGAAQELPERLRATYSKQNGVRYLLGAYDVHTDRFHSRLRAHENGGEVLAFYRQIRMRYARTCGSTSSPITSPRTGPRRSASGQSRPTSSSSSRPPTRASSATSCHFWAIGEFVIKNADYPDWDTFAKVMADHITYRNGPHRHRRLIKAERRLLIAA